MFMVLYSDMSAPIREMICCYESDGQFAVPESYARHVFEEAAIRVGEYTGPIRLLGFQAVTITIEGAPRLDVDAITLPRLGARHVGLITQRVLVDPIDGGDAAGVAIIRPDGSSLSVVRKIPRFNRAFTVDLTKHELGHTFGLALSEHCSEPSCVMAATHDKSDYSSPSSQLTFCKACQGCLERAGSRAIRTVNKR